MANEKRLIDANAFKMFLEDVRQDYLEEGTFSSDFAAKVIETVQDEYLALAPTVDAVEVVRCKDCKCWCYEYDDVGLCVTDVPDIDGVQRLADDFCSYGERRTDDYC